MGWSEPASTNTPVEDEPVQPVLRMNILPARGVFFFHLFSAPPTSPLLSPLLPPPPSYLPPTNPTPLTPSLELELWSGRSSCGAVAVELCSCCCGAGVRVAGVGAGARAARVGARARAAGVRVGVQAAGVGAGPTRPRNPRAHDQVRCLPFLCLFCLKRHRCAPTAQRSE